MEEQRWLRQAEKDLESARDSLAARHYEWGCFQAQQAVKEGLEAFLYSKGLRAILTHSIRDLVLDCSKYEAEFANLVTEAKSLDAHYISIRYPDSLVGDSIPSEYYSQEGCRKMHKLCRIDIEQREKIYEELKNSLSCLESNIRSKKSIYMAL